MVRRPPDTLECLTAAGPAAIAVVRLCGPGVAEFLARHALPRTPAAPWTAGSLRRVTLLDTEGSPLDDALLSIHAAAPDWDVRIHLHGGVGLVRRWIELADAAGFASSDPPQPIWSLASEIEREAGALLPHFRTDSGVAWLRRQAHELPIELARLLECADLAQVRVACAEIAARLPIATWFQHPARIALSGPPNAGKSTLINALSDREVSLVSDRPGTTRDWIEATGELAGYPVVWIDTAGLRQTCDSLEAAGVTAALQSIVDADLIIAVVGLAESDVSPAIEFRRRFSDMRAALTILNKSDLAPSQTAYALDGAGISGVHVSAIRREGLDHVRAAVLAALGRSSAQLSSVSAFTSRQHSALLAAQQSSDLEAVRRCIAECIG